MKYEKAVENRKEIVKRLEALTGEKAKYTRLPRCAYEIGEFTVERDGALVTSEAASQDIINVLIAEGLIVSSGVGAVPEINTADIRMPLNKHSVQSLINLINIIYTWGPLMSKATGGHFQVKKSLITALNSQNFSNVDAVLAFIEENNSELEGISFGQHGDIIFAGFDDAVSIRNSGVYARLAHLINKATLASKHIAAQEITEPNEKYAMRCWLVKLGMTGEDLKFDRAVLLAGLNGDSVFRANHNKEVWLAGRNKKKEIIRSRISALLASDVGILRR